MKEIASLEEMDNGVYETIKLTGLESFIPINKLKEIANNIKEEGNLLINISKLSEEDLKKLKSNLRLSGYTIKEEGEIVNCTRKIWSKNKTDNPWKLIKLEDKPELILEKELIDPKAKDTYQKFSKEDDCITKPKACKNCRCGRADEENKQKNENVVPNMKPECGKCYLGDAYRCGGCPYRGMPAFEPGDKIEIKNIQIAEKVQAEKTEVHVTGNKVKLDI
jgi:hypothetical protein